MSEATDRDARRPQGLAADDDLGTLPALLTFFFRIFVPESHKWEEEQGKGSTSHWATVDLLGVLIGALGPGLIVYVWADEGRVDRRCASAARIVGSGRSPSSATPIRSFAI